MSDKLIGPELPTQAEWFIPLPHSRGYMHFRLTLPLRDKDYDVVYHILDLAREVIDETRLAAIQHSKEEPIP